MIGRETLCDRARDTKSGDAATYRLDTGAGS